MCIVHLGGVDVGDDEFRASAVQQFAERHADVAEPLHRDVQTGQREGAAAEPFRHHADALEDPLGGARAGIAATSIAADAGDVAGAFRHLQQIGDAHADVFRGHVLAAEFLDPLAEAQQLGLGHRRGGCAVLSRRREDDALAAAEGNAGEGVLVRHAVGQAHRVGTGGVDVRIVPAANAAERRPQGDVVEGEHGLQAGARVVLADDAVKFVNEHGALNSASGRFWWRNPIALERGRSLQFSYYVSL